jgi:hypothetical protein
LRYQAAVSVGAIAAPVRRRGRADVHRLVLGACGCRFEVVCEDRAAAALVRASLGELACAAAPASERPPCIFVVRKNPAGRSFELSLGDGVTRTLEHPDDLIYDLDKQITLELQYQRPDLFFVHAGVLELDGRAIVLPAPSGTGKSTLTLALVSRGFGYLSDELAPIDLARRTVHAYSHALCLKAVPGAITLPPGTVQTPERWYVPPSALRARQVRSPTPIAALAFVRRHGTGPRLSRLSPARAAAHLLNNALNPSAHPQQGLEAALSLAQSVACYEVDSSDLALACDALFETARTHPAGEWDASERASVRNLS